MIFDNDAKLAHILVVDDEPEIRSGLSRILRLEGYHATEAATGEAALLLVKDLDFDLVLLDIRMPGQGGMSVVKHISAKRLDLPIIILTGYGSLETAINAIRSKVVADYLIKPVDNEAVIRTVSATVTENRLRRQQSRLASAAATMLDALGEREAAPYTDRDNTCNDDPNDNSTSPIEAGAEPGPADTPNPVIAVPPLTLNYNQRQVIVQNDGAPPLTQELTKGELAVLKGLMRAPHRPLSCSKLAELGWGYQIDEHEAESMIRPYIFRLRQKLENNPKKPRLIQTVRNRGYRFVPDRSSTHPHTPAVSSPK
jgi:DNA-binding response OmpR family regulator